jgi:hypothetical protein
MSAPDSAAQEQACDLAHVNAALKRALDPLAGFTTDEPDSGWWLRLKLWLLSLLVDGRDL